MKPFARLFLALLLLLPALAAQAGVAVVASLTASNDIILDASENRYSQQSSQSSNSASIGVSIGMGSSNGISFNAGVSSGSSQGSGDGVIYTNTHVSSNGATTLTSGGDTTLKGAVSQQQAMKAKGMTEQQIAKASDTKPSAAAGVGSASENQSSTTTSGISGVAGDTSVRTGDTTSAGTLLNNWNSQASLKDVQGQAQITSEFGKQASIAVGSYADQQLQEAIANKDQQGIDDWKEGGTYRVLAHATIGALTGGVDGALGAAASQVTIAEIGKQIADTDLPLAVKQALVAASGAAVGAAAGGGSTGAAAATNATVNNYLQVEQLQRKFTQGMSYQEQVALSLANNQKVEDACVGGGSPGCTAALNKAQSDLNALQNYKADLSSQLASDPGNKTLQDQITNVNANIVSANNAIAFGKLAANGGTYDGTTALPATDLMRLGVLAGVADYGAPLNVEVFKEFANKVNAAGSSGAPQLPSGAVYGDGDLANVHSNQIGGKPLGTPVGTYDMVSNPGPLAQLPNNPAANFAGGQYTAITLTEDTILYRGGSSAGSPLGQWFTVDAPTSVSQVRIDTAVRPQWMDAATGALTGTSPVDAVYSIKVPAGTTVYYGPTAYQGDIYLGGAGANQSQIFIPRSTTGLTVINSTPIH